MDDQMGFMMGGMTFGLAMQEIVKVIMGRMGAKKPITASLMSIMMISVVTRGSRGLSEFANLCWLWFQAAVQKFFNRSVIRTIRYTASVTGAADAATEKNNILHKAIRFYINKNTHKLHYKEAELYLESSEVTEGEPQDNMDPFMRMRFGGRGGSKPGENKQQAIQAYQVKKTPIQENWDFVDEDRQIEYYYTEKDIEPARGKGSGDSDNTSSSTGYKGVTVHLRASGYDAEQKVDSFVEKAMEYYKELKKNQVDNNRYFFVAQSDGTGLKKSGGDQMYRSPFDPPAADGFKFKKYVLSDNKDFDSLFFEEKDEILKYLDTFRNKTGKFALKGYPYKLGLLLYGPPGTGKTSLIKSIATYFKRHIVDVPLAKIRTNQELLDLMNDLVFEGEDEPVKMKFDDLVFVMEDVDAASDVVYKRAEAKEDTEKDKSEEAAAEAECNEHQTDLLVKGVSGKGVEKISEIENHVVVDEDESREKDNDAKDTEITKETPNGDAEHKEKDKSKEKESADGDKKDKSKENGAADGDENDKSKEKVAGDDDEKGKSGDSSNRELLLEFKEMKVKVESEIKELKHKIEEQQLMAMRDAGEGKGPGIDKNDKLNLQGLLNTLDGVVDAPGRILIMTTNHHKKLDEALIRPGRINRCIELSYMKPKPLEKLISYLMCDGGELSSQQQARCVGIAEQENRITPAVVESASADLESVDELLDKLEGHGKTSKKIEMKRALSRQLSNTPKAKQWPSMAQLRTLKESDRN